MKKIAFKNFRRFLDFPPLELGEITIMVGKNNSGKSTMVKALLLTLDYLQHQQYNKFSFTNMVLEDANIVTFGRAMNNNTESKEIVFQLEVDAYLFSMSIYGDDGSTNATVSKININDAVNNIFIEIDYAKDIINISKKNTRAIDESYDNYRKLTELIEDLNFQIKKINVKKSSPERLRLINEVNDANEKLNKYRQIYHKEKGMESDLFDINYPLKLNPNQNKIEETIFQEFISDFSFQNDAEIKKMKNIRNEYVHKLKDWDAIESELELLFKDEVDVDVNNGEKSNFQKLEEKIQYLVDIDNYKFDLKKSIDEAVRVLNNTQVYYLGANPSKQSALFSIRDKQNNLAQAIHEFKQSNISTTSEEFIFVKKWMKDFEVGVNFEIKFYAGEAYEFYVVDGDGTKAHLADKGMGSLQAMMLILKIATIIRNNSENLNNATVIVEEPELNLHPALQSKLAEFFHFVNKEYKIKFIIETHSEYLIRMSQLIVAQEKYTTEESLNPNPFKVHYFDMDSGPYVMNFTENGKFDRNFGEGFYDEAVKKMMALIHEQRKKE